MAEIIQVELRQSGKFMKEYKNEGFLEYLDIIGDIIIEGQKRGLFNKDVIPGVAKRAFFWCSRRGVPFLGIVEPQTV